MAIHYLQAGTRICVDNRILLMRRKIDGQLWQLEEQSTNRIVEWSEDQLRHNYATRKLTFYNDPAHPSSKLLAGRTYKEIPSEQLTKAKIRRAYVQAILHLPYTKSAISPVTEELWKKLQQPEKCPSWISVYRWKSRYLSAQKDINAIVDQSQRKGNRKPRYPQEVIDFAENAIDQIYLQRERRTIADTLEKAQLFVIRENRLRPDALQLPIPTRRLITTLIQKIPAFDRAVAREGREAARRRFRSVLAHRITEAPLNRAEIDHTQLDVFVLDDETGLPLGRPWITVCIDDYSRCILGIFISFEPPSYFTVSQCLKDALTPKQWLHDQYPEIANAWNAHGIMEELVVDNGPEFHSAALEAACLSLGIDIHYSARKTPWFKGKIERFLGTLNAGIAHGTPGTTFRNILEKDDYNPLQHAVVRLSTLRKVVRLWIADYYHQKPHRSLQEAPAIVWSSSIAPEDIPLADNLEKLDVILGRPEQRMLTHKGVELDGLLYNSPELTRLRRRYGDTLKVDIRIDDSNLGLIMVLSPDKSTHIPVPALKQRYAQGLTRWQHKVCKRFAAEALGRHDPIGWLEAKEKISLLIQEEFQLKKQKSRARAKRFTTTRDELLERRPPERQRLLESNEMLAAPSHPVLPTTTPQGFKRFQPLITTRITDGADVTASKGGDHVA